MAKQNALGNVVDNVVEAAGRVVAGVRDAMTPVESDDSTSGAAEAPQPVDAIALLESDHDKVKVLFAQADALSDTAQAARLKLFKEIDAELTLHTQVEEQIFYPALKAKTKRNSDERDEVLEAYEEHASAKDLIAKLEALDARDETYKAKLQVLGEMVKHHIHEEESTMFPQARTLLERDELEELGSQIQAAKQKAKGKSTPAKSNGKTPTQNGTNTAQNGAKTSAQNGAKTAQNGVKTAQNGVKTPAQNGKKTPPQNGMKTPAKNGAKTAQSGAKTAKNGVKTSASKSSATRGSRSGKTTPRPQSAAKRRTK